MFKRIVVGCDGSAEQADAIALAQQLRDPDGGTLVLTTVFSLSRPLSGSGGMGEYGRWLGERAAETVADAQRLVDPDVPVDRQVIAASSAAAGLNDVGETVDADLIVLGGSERGTLAELAGRKTVQRLLHGAPCAVAVAARGQAARLQPGSELFVAYDTSPEASLALTTAFSIARARSARVRVCEVLEPIEVAADFVKPLDDGHVEDSVRDGLAAAAATAPAGLEVTPQLLKGSPPHRLLLEAAAGADLIVAGSRGYGAVQRAIAGGTSIYLLTDAPAGVLVTPRVVANRAGRPA